MAESSVGAGCPWQLLQRLDAIVAALRHGRAVEREAADVLFETLLLCPEIVEQSGTTRASADASAAPDPFKAAVWEAREMLALYRTVPVFSSHHVIARLLQVTALGRDRLAANRRSRSWLGISPVEPTKRAWPVGPRHFARDVCARCPVTLEAAG